MDAYCIMAGIFGGRGLSDKNLIRLISIDGDFDLPISSILEWAHCIRIWPAIKKNFNAIKILN